MEATTWLDRQQDRESAGWSGAGAAGAALPLLLWAVVLLGTSGAAAIGEVPLWAYALLIAAPAALLGLALALRSLLRPLPGRSC
jgi:hypothetical protein